MDKKEIEEVVKENLITEPTKTTIKENLTDEPIFPIVRKNLTVEKTEATCKENLLVEKKKKKKQYPKSFPVISRQSRDKKERNVNCSCGSGKKYKNCCLIKEKKAKWMI